MSSVDKPTAKIVAYSFLGVAILSYLFSFYYYNKITAHSEYESYSKLLATLCAISILGSAAAGMAWKQSKGSADIINFVNCVLASFLVVYGKYYDWSYTAISLGTIIGVLSCTEFIVD